VPAFGALVAEPLFLLADSAIVGRLGTVPLAGLGVAGALLATAIGIFVFLAYGTTAAVARRVGAGDLRGAITDGVDGMWLAALLGLVVAGAGGVLAVPLVAAFGPSVGVAEQAVTYLRWSLPGLPAMLVVLAATGILRGLQDTRTPLVVAAAGAAANVVLSVALVHGAGLGIAGSAIGTVLAQVGMAAAFLVVVVRAARRTGASLRPEARGVLRVGRTGVPLLARTLTLRAALLVTTYVAVAQGDAPLAAHQVATVVWGLLALALDAVAIAGQALTGRALGAGDAAGARALTRRMLAWGTGTGAGFGVLLLAGRGLLAPLFSPEPAVRSSAGRGAAGRRAGAAAGRLGLRPRRRADRGGRRALPGGGRAVDAARLPAAGGAGARSAGDRHAGPRLAVGGLRRGLHARPRHHARAAVAQ
jgi:putative MATE family efflux protein